MIKSHDEMAPDERVTEVAALLAQGILRMKQRNMRKSKAESVISLDSSGNQSACAVEHSETGK